MYLKSSTTVKVFATGLKGYKTVQAISEETKDVIVVIGRDLNVKNDFSKEIESLCKENKLEYTYDTKSNSKEFGLAIAAGWQRMIFDIPSSALIVFHDSLLPRYRGFNPLVTALLNKDDVIGLTALLAADDYDCGDIISQIKIPVSYPIVIEDAIKIVSEAYYDVAKKAYAMFVSNKLIGKPQDNELATYSLWRDNDDYSIDWRQASEEIQQLVNCVGYPYLGASTFIGDDQVRIKEVSLVKDVVIENRTPGKIIFFDNGKPVVVCGSGLLKLEEIEDNDGNLVNIKKLRTRFK